MRDRSRTGQATLLAVSISAGIALASPSIAADLTATLDAGAGFSVRDDTGAIERLRVDEATGNLSRNGALFVHTTGNHNLFVGAGAGSLTTTGFTGANAAFGEAALGAITTGFWNAALGYRALAANTSGDRNAALGTRALEHNTTGFFNTATGHRSLGSNTTGYYNTSTGTYAMGLNTTGTRNTALGDAALQSNQNGSRNTGSGFLALTSNTVGFQNPAAGSGALAYNTSGSKNTAAGAESLRSNTTGSNNTAAGYGALYSLTSGSSNIAVGYTAGAGLTAGSNNIYLANQGAAAESGQIRIGTLGTHTQTTIAGIHGRTSTGGIAVLVNASGTLGTTTSSARFKRDDEVTVTDRCAGFGDTVESAKADGVHAFCCGTFHVLLAALWGVLERDQVDHEILFVEDREWDVYMGPCTSRASAGVSGLVLPQALPNLVL